VRRTQVMAAIAGRVPASVTGDGISTFEQLVDLANVGPRRRVGHEKVLTRIKVDEAAIQRVREQGPRVVSVSVVKFRSPRMRRDLKVATPRRGGTSATWPFSKWARIQPSASGALLRRAARG